MKATFTINQLQFELDAEEARDLFQQVAQIQEIFEAETQCGCCQSDDIRYSYRVAGSYKFYELLCRQCGAQFRFGQKKETLELFPKRTDDGKLLPNHGWSKYEPRDGDEPRSQPRNIQQAKPAAAAPRPAPSSGAAAEFPTWLAASESKEHWGDKYIKITGEGLFVLGRNNEYEPVPAPRTAPPPPAGAPATHPARR